MNVHTMATWNLARSSCILRLDGLRSVFYPQNCLNLQIGTLRWGGMTPRCFCSRRLLRVAARSRRPSLIGTSHQRIQHSKGQVDRNPRKGQVTIDHKVWILRLAHENSYLSWSRNAAICAGVAATVRMVEKGFDPSTTVFAHTFITGFADLGLVFIVYGSFHHLYQAFRLKKALQLTRPEFLWVCAYTTAIGFIYYMLIHSKFNVLANW